MTIDREAQQAAYSPGSRKEWDTTEQLNILNDENRSYTIDYRSYIIYIQSWRTEMDTWEKKQKSLLFPRI